MRRRGYSILQQVSEKDFGLEERVLRTSLRSFINVLSHSSRGNISSSHGADRWSWSSICRYHFLFHSVSWLNLLCHQPTYYLPQIIRQMDYVFIFSFSLQVSKFPQILNFVFNDGNLPPSVLYLVLNQFNFYPTSQTDFIFIINTTFAF